jgi:hypothetical protein
MSSDFQTFAALAVVALTAMWFVARAIARRKGPSCGDGCGAVSPEVKALQARLKQRR